MIPQLRVPVSGAAADPARHPAAGRSPTSSPSRRKNRRGMRFTNTSMLDVVVPQAVAVATAPRGRAVAAQPDHPDRGVRPAQDPGRRAPGAGHRGAGDRRLAVHAGHRRQARPGWTRPRRRRSSSSTELPDKYNVSVVSMAGQRLDPGAADAGPQHGRERDQQHPAAGLARRSVRASSRPCRALRQAPKDPNNPTRSRRGPS